MAYWNENNPGPPGEITPGELGRVLHRFMIETDRNFQSLQQQLTHSIETRMVGIDYYNARHTALQDRVRTLETGRDAALESRGQMVRAVTVAIITAALSLFASIIVVLVTIVLKK